MEATLLLGSNLGDRQSNLETALSSLEALFRTVPVLLSPVLETEACGFEGPAFLNQAVVFNTELSPEDLLAACKHIEREMGRTDTPQYDESRRRIYHDRIIDIDILFYGNIRMDTDLLTIPHPQVETRPFVRELLLSIDQKRG